MSPSCRASSTPGPGRLLGNQPFSPIRDRDYVARFGPTLSFQIEGCRVRLCSDSRNSSSLTCRSDDFRLSSLRLWPPSAMPWAVSPTRPASLNRWDHLRLEEYAPLHPVGLPPTRVSTVAAAPPSGWPSSSGLFCCPNHCQLTPDPCLLASFLPRRLSHLMVDSCLCLRLGSEFGSVLGSIGLLR